MQVRGIIKSFAKRAVVRGVSLDVSRGQVAALLGPNGAGKTTCFYTVVGLVKPDAGAIFIDRQDITGMPMYQRARMGISYLAQEASIFRGMTVEQNIMSVVELREPDRAKAARIVTDLLDELRISHIRTAAAPGLSGGERRRVEIARALANDPSFLLMDEPFAGLDPLAVADIAKVVAQLKARGLGILITDHNVRETLEIVDWASIIHDGQVLFEGAPADIMADPEVRRVYLGSSFDTEADTPQTAVPPVRGALEAPVDPARNTRRVAMSRGGVGGPATADAVALQLQSLALKRGGRLTWKEFWELTNKPKNSPLVFGGGIFCGLVFGAFLGSVVLHPNKPVIAGSGGGAVLASRAGVARGEAYVQAFKQVSDSSIWTSYAAVWQISKPPYKVLGEAPQTIETPVAQFDYAAVSKPLDAAIVADQVILRVDVADAKGKIGVSLLNPAGSPLVTEEQIVTAADGERSLFFQLRAQDLPAEFLIRNGGDASGEQGSITIKHVYIAKVADLSDMQMNAIRKIGLNKPLKP